MVNAPQTIVHHFAQNIPGSGRPIRVCHREHGNDRLHLCGRAHRLAFLLPLQHQPVTRGAAAVLWGSRTPARQAQRHLIAVTSRFRVEKSELPFPKIDSSARVEKRLPQAQSKIPQCFPLHLRPAEKAAELLAVDVKAETKAIPAQKSTEDLIET